MYYVPCLQVICLSFLIVQSVCLSLSNTARVRRQDNDECGGELEVELPQFRCKNGDCISGDLECNGYVDCKDGSDESDDCKSIICSPHLFKCSYGACIKKELECDGKFDCRDGSDENSPNCTQSTQCNDHEFRCASGQCIDRKFKCDGRAECDDQSDEIKSTCFDVECPGNLYKCNYGACAPGNAECNGVLECYDGSDEDPNICKTNTVPTVTPSHSPEENGCILPEHPASGKWSIHAASTKFYPGQTVSIGTVLQVRCDNKYKLEGNNALFCEEGGRWSSNIGFCSKLCDARFSTPTMRVTCIYKNRETENCTEPVDGTLVRLECVPFYEAPSLKRRPVHICKDGNWDYHKPECEPICGQKSVDATRLIINGTNAVKGDYPWQVAVYTIPNKELICGGSLVTQRFILTAAHCITDVKGNLQPKENYKVAVGKYYREFDDKRDKEAQFSEIESMFIPRQYEGDTQNFLGDIAILITTNIFVLSRTIQPVCLDLSLNYNVPPNTNGYVSGWGFTVENSKPSKVLKELKVPSVSVATCRSYLPEDYDIFLTYDKMCAGYVEKGTSVCKGDSGGGLVFKHEGRYYVTGIVSLAPTSPTLVDGCDRNQYGLYTKVVDYINDFLLPKLAEYKV